MITADQPKVSIMMPIYNAEDYLAETLDTVCAQTYENLEVILVDDGSTDCSGEICEAYAAKDARFRVFHKPNGGEADARNYALRQISGDYAMFVDSDDLVKPNYIQAMVYTALSNHARLVTCEYVNGKRVSRDAFYHMELTDTPEGRRIPLSEYRYTSQHKHDVIWGCLFDVSLIGGKQFDRDLFVGPDTYFFAQLLKENGEIIYVDVPYCYYTYRENSIANATYNPRQSTEILSWERVCALFSDQSPAFMDECRAALAYRCKKNFDRAYEAGVDDKAMLREFYRKAAGLRRYVLHSTELGVVKKLLFALFVYCPGGYKIWRKLRHNVFVARK